MDREQIIEVKKLAVEIANIPTDHMTQMDLLRMQVLLDVMYWSIAKSRGEFTPDTSKPPPNPHDVGLVYRSLVAVP